MRYDDWDVLLFPSGRDARVPLKEFKVNCHVVPDGEFSHNRGGFGLPAMTCFIPSLPVGANFHISIHCWGTPQISQYTLNYSKHPELVKFEARIMIDGRIVASTSFDPLGQWPHLITNTCEMSKQGELESLKFPSFRRELLYQNHWNPADDLGRIKVIISEGFPRDSPSNPIERVKNIVIFSFQHAPLDILETNGIAWPNPQMWRRPQNNPAMPIPTYYPDDGADSHLHSPRRRSYIERATGGSCMQASTACGSVANSTATVGHLPAFQTSTGSSSSGFVDPFSEAAYHEWVNSLGLHQQQQTIEPKSVWANTNRNGGNGHTANDMSMPNISDYLTSTMGHDMGADATRLANQSLDDDPRMENLQVPANTPTTLMGPGSGIPGHGMEQAENGIPTTAISAELASSLTHSLLNQPHPLTGATHALQPHQIPLPASEVRSRKENRHLNNASSIDAPSDASPSVEAQIRKFSQSNNAFGFISNDRDSSGSGTAISRRTSGGEFGANITNHATPNQTYAGVAASAAAPGSGSEQGTKRGRNFTPASAKAIDEEDEPRRASPRIRSGANPPQTVKDHEKIDE